DSCHATGGVEIAGYEMLKGLEGIKTHRSRVVVPIFGNTQDIAAMAEEVRAWLCEAAAEGTPGPHAFLIHKHGLYTWGPSVAAARRQIEVLEFLFECEWRKMSAA
ncbi:MAG: class II aldolase/adducin family protein, partial [Planctomycetota bacterium]